MTERPQGWVGQTLDWVVRGSQPPEYDYDSQKAARDRLSAHRRFWRILGTVLVTTAIAYPLSSGGSLAPLGPAFRFSLFALGIVSLITGNIFFSTAEAELLMKDLRIRTQVETMYGDENKEGWKRAYFLFLTHQQELRRYYDLARRQSITMLFVGLVCIALGFVVVIATGWIILDPPASVKGVMDSEGKYIVGTVGAVEGILVNYVAAVYMRMFAATSSALSEFHNRLVGTHRLHFANYLAWKIDSRNQRNQALKKMAEELATD